METMFKELKLVKGSELDTVAINKHIDDTFVDENWRKVLKAATDECSKRLKPRILEIQKKLEAAPFNIRKDQCDVQFMAYVACTNLECFAVFPDVLNIESS